MQFKYHGAYRAYYLYDGKKFVKPFQKLDMEETEKQLAKKGLKIKELADKVVEIDETCLVFVDTKQVKKYTKKAKPKINEDKNTLVAKYSAIIPKEILGHLAKRIEVQEKSQTILASVLDIIDTVIYSDTNFKSKIRKISFYPEAEIKDYLERFFSAGEQGIDVESTISKNYPYQYIYENLPLDYKEKEMMYVFYFIILIELLVVLK